MLFAKKDRDKNNGFAITLTLGVGLVLTVVGVSVILKGVVSKNDAESQDRKNVAAALAEAGIASAISELIQDQSLIRSNENVCVTATAGTSPGATPSLVLVENSAVKVNFNREKNTGVLDSVGRYKNAAHRIQVSFPIESASLIDIEALPGLWTEQLSGNGLVYGNISLAGSCLDGVKAQQLPVNDPDLDLPLGNKTPELDSTQGKVISSQPLPQLGEFSLPNNYNAVDCDTPRTVTLPRESDDPELSYLLIGTRCRLELGDSTNDTARIYNVYVNDDLELNGNQNFGASNLNLHVNGNLTLSGTARLGGYNSVIRVYGDRVITQRGTGDFYGLIFAPDSDYSVVGTAKIGGALWVKTANLGNSSTPRVFQNISDNFASLLKSAEVSGLPQTERIMPISSFVSLPVQD